MREILPRQARDKHRGTQQKGTLSRRHRPERTAAVIRFYGRAHVGAQRRRKGSGCGARPWPGGCYGRPVAAQVAGWRGAAADLGRSPRKIVCKNRLSPTFPTGNDHFTKTGSGQTYQDRENSKREWRILRSAIRYVTEHHLAHAAEFGMSSEIFGTIIAAAIYGKDEQNTFGFNREWLLTPCSQRLHCLHLPTVRVHTRMAVACGRAEKDIDGFIDQDRELLRCETFGGIWQLAPTQCRGLLSFCISDAAKQLLLNHAGFIPHMVRHLCISIDHSAACRGSTFF
eukprot:COSAG06_NODE_129_length_22602_cov_7.116318_9_plen_284_part_00